MGILSASFAFVAVAVFLRLSTDGDCRDLGLVSELPPDSVSFTPCANVFIVHGRGEYVIVFLAESPTSRGVQLRYDATRHLFFDSLHEQFDVHGNPVDGTGTRTPLMTCPTVVRDGGIRIPASSPSRESIRAACFGSLLVP